MNRPTTIPLFPLPLVVLPGEPRLLHIFEDRYRKLLQDSLKKQEDGAFSEFGIVFQDSEGLAPVGTSIQVEQVLKKYDEGPSDILIRGHDRFRIAEVHQLEIYQTADIEWMEDTEPDWDEDLATEAYQLHRTLTKIVLGEYVGDENYSGKSSLSYTMAQSSGMGPVDVQKLLEITSENARLHMLNKYIQSVLPALQKTEIIKGTIRENWGVQKFTRGEAST